MYSTAAFEGFLTSYKGKSSSDTANALNDLHIDEDGLSDEYDFMDDVDGGDETRRRDRATAGPKKKYMSVLQDVADRNATEVLIELDDVDEVCDHRYSLCPRRR